MLKVELLEQPLFFDRYYHQLSNIRSMGVDNKTIWNVFCEINNIPSKKQELTYIKDLEKLDKLTDDEIYRRIGMAISKIFKGQYKGEGL